MNQPTSQRRNDLISLGLVLVTLAVYWPVRHFQFVNYDDAAYVSQNPPVQSGVTLKGLAWAFTTKHQANWHPLTWISHMLDCQFFGLDAGAHHLVNVLIHIATTLLLFHVLNRMTAAPWRIAFVAALFAWHPLHVESVAWVAERKDVLSALFWMLTLWAYVRYVEGFKVQGSGFCRSPDTSVGAKGLPGRAREGAPTKHRSPLSSFYALALLFFALGLMAKPMLVTLPFVLLLLDYWPLGRTRWANGAIASGGPRSVVAAGIEIPPAVVTEADPPNNISLASLGRLITEKLPFLVLALVSSAVTVWAQSAEAISSLQALPLGTRLANAVVAYPTYLGKSFWPSGLAVFYPYPKWPWEVVAVSAAVLLGASALVICRARRNPQFLVGWLWFLGTLVPVIGLVQVGGQALADRYTYLPLIGLFLMAAWAIPNRVFEQRAVETTHKTKSCSHAALPACGGKSYRTAPRGDGAPRLQQITVATAAALLGACAIVCRFQVAHWQDTETLFGHALAVTKNNWLAHYNLGVYLMKQGRLEESIAHYEQAVQIRPDYFEAHNNMAFALRKAGRLPEAIEHWEQTLRIWPSDAEVHNNLGLALLQDGRVQDAIGHFEQALRIKPNAAAVHLNFGLALEQAGKIDDAISHYEEALRLRPDLTQARIGLARLQAAR